MINKPTEEEEKNIKTFISKGFFKIIIRGDYKFFGIKRGYLKQLRVDYTHKEIISFLNRIEELINYGAICEDCLSFCNYWSEPESNAEGFKCLNCGSKF